MTGGSARRTEQHPPPVPGPDRQTEFSAESNSGRLCVCGGVIPAERGPDAVYCSAVCRDKQARLRRAAREAVASTCAVCPAAISTKRTYCEPCRVEVRRGRVARRRAERLSAAAPVAAPGWVVPASTVGALNELLVAADLLRCGYQVFRALSPSCPCDLIILNGEMTARVEVRSISRNKLGELRRGFRSEERGRFDVLARIESDGTIHYSGLEGVRRG